jgi:hypothetical protein
MAAYTTIDDPEAYFQVKTYTGNNTTDTAITFDGDTDMQPNFVWIKCRSSAGVSSALFNSVSGSDYHLVSNTTAAQAGDGSYFKSFDSDGFTLGTGGQVNDSGVTYVGWCWKESADAGFDIVSFTGDESVRTVAHNLSAVPHVMIMKSTANTAGWGVYHHKTSSTPAEDYLYLDTTAVLGDSVNFWNDTAPTTSVFSLGASGVSNKTGAMIGFLWSEKQGFSKFGEYTGNGSADGTFVFCGFRPAYIMIRETGNAENWFLFDNKRDGYNVNKVLLYANTTTADTTTGANQIDLLSNGFKCRSTDNGTNRSGAAGFIYMAFAEAPFVNSNGVPCNAR